MFWMRAYPLRGQVGWGWALELESFLGPVKYYAQGCNHRYIGGFMHKSPQGRFQGPYWGGWRSRCIKELDRSARAAPSHYKTY